MKNIKNSLILFLIAFTALGMSSCNKNGCIDSTALNYDADAKKDDGSCVYLTENLHFKLRSKMGTQDFVFNTNVQSSSGRMVKFTRAQMYLSGFAFNGSGSVYNVADSYLLVKAETEDYDLGHLPVGSYSSFSFSAGVDSAANHVDPATWASEIALSANNPDHMHWGWDPGFIFFVVEGDVDTSAAMNGDVNAPFIFHIGMDANLIEIAFVQNVESTSNNVTVEVDFDWLSLINEMNMTADIDSRVSHTMDNMPLANVFVSNIEAAFSLHQ